MNDKKLLFTIPPVKVNSTLTLDGVNLRLLEQQRKSLNRSLDDAKVCEQLKRIGTLDDLSGLAAMLDHWSDNNPQTKP